LKCQTGHDEKQSPTTCSPLNPSGVTRERVLGLRFQEEDEVYDDGDDDYDDDEGNSDSSSSSFDDDEHPRRRRGDSN